MILYIIIYPWKALPQSGFKNFMSAPMMQASAVYLQILLRYYNEELDSQKCQVRIFILNFFIMHLLFRLTF